MIKTFDLVKIFLNETYRFSGKGNGARSAKKNSKAALILILCLVPVYMIMFTSSYVAMFGNYVGNIEIFDKVTYTICFLTNLAALFFIVLSGNMMAMSEKDNDVLATLPIPERKIVSAKLITAMIIESIFSIYIGTCGLIAYIIVGNISFNGILILLITPILSTVIPTVLFSFLILVIKKAIQKSKYKRIIELVGLVLMMIFIFALSFLISMNTSMTGENGQVDIELLNKMIGIYEKFMTYYPPLILIKIGVETSNVLFTILYAVVVILIFIGFVLIFEKYAFKFMVYEKTNNGSNKKDKVEYKKDKIFNCLLRKEFSKLFSDNLYIINVLFMPALVIIGSIVLAFFSRSMIIPIDEEGLYTINISHILYPFILLILAMMSLSSAFTLSLENRSTWLLKTLPIDEKDIFKSKAVFNFILYLIPALICYIAFIIGALPPFILALSTIVLAFGAIFYTTYLNQYINLKHPAIDLEDKFVIKQSSSVMISSFLMVGEMLIIPGLGVALYIFTGMIWLTVLILGIILSLLGLLFYLLIRKNGTKLYKKFA